MSTMIDDALALFTTQFEDSENLQELARALLSPYINLETALDDLFLKRYIDTAEGLQLDKLGGTLGIKRRGRDDESYRSALSFQVFINTSKAEPETLIEASRTLSSGNFVRYWENYPAGFQIFTDGINTLNVNSGAVEVSTLIGDNGDRILLDNGDTLQLVTSFGSNESLVKFLGQISPAGVDNIAVSFSLGNTPLFGFGGDFIFASLNLENGDRFVLDDGNGVEMLPGEIAPSTDGFEGFSELTLSTMTLENGDTFNIIFDGSATPLGLSDANGDTVGGGKLVEVTVDY